MFGPIAGASIYCRAKYSQQEVHVTVPGLRSTLRLRGGTSDRHTFQKVFLDHEYDVDLGFTPRTIIDGGANVGYSSVYFAQSYPDALVLAVEPEPTNYRLLTSNTETYSNIRRFNCALWPNRSYLSLENHSGNTDAFIVRETDQKTPGAIPAMSITDLLLEASIDSIDLLKLDIEGAEKELFQNHACSSWLERTRALILELHDRLKPGCTDAVEHAIAGLPFRKSHVGEHLVLLREG